MTAPVFTLEMLKKARSLLSELPAVKGFFVTRVPMSEIAKAWELPLSQVRSAFKTGAPIKSPEGLVILLRPIKLPVRS